MNPNGPRNNQRPLPTTTVRVRGRSSADRSFMSELTTPSPPGHLAATSSTSSRTSVLQHYPAPVLSPHAPAEVDHDALASVAARQMEEDRNGGDGGDSDEDGDEFQLHGDNEGESLEEIEGESLTVEKVGVAAFAEEPGVAKGLLDVTNSDGDIMGNVTLYDDTSFPGRTVNMPGMNMSHVKVPRVPDEYVAPEAKHDRNEPSFNTIDNPGEWPRYCFQPKFASRSNTSEYKHHAMPTGAVPVPKDANGKRKINGWEFHYNGWSNPDAPYRRGATAANLFPKEMDGNLCPKTLKKLGLTEAKMVDLDALFFLQLILPICDVLKSGIIDDPRLNYYYDVERFTNIAKFNSGMGASYGHTWKQVTNQEMVIFDGVLVRDGVLGGSQGAIHRRWDKGSVCYDTDIASAMTYTRFCEIKRNKKLCNNDQAPKRGQGK